MPNDLRQLICDACDIGCPCRAGSLQMVISTYSGLYQVNTFVPRSPRFGLDLPIRFFSPDGLAVGRCVDVSESGLLGFFDRPLSVWTSGELTASLGDESVSVKARVARVDGRQAGLSFQSENDRLAILKLIDFAVRNGQ